MALISHYKLNGNMKNELGAPGELKNGSYISGVDGEGLRIDYNEVDGGFVLPASATNSTTGDLAISFWAKIDCQGRYTYFIDKDIDSSSNYNINIHFPWTNNNIYWDIGNNTTSYNRINKVIDDKYLGDGLYHHWVFQLNSVTDTQQIWLDGALWYSVGSKTIPFVNSAKDIIIGKNWFGVMDDLRIYDKALDKDEVKELYYEFRTRLKFKLNTDFYQQFIDGSDKGVICANSQVESGDGKTSKYSAYFNGDTSHFLRVSMNQVHMDSTDKDFSWGGWMMKNKHTSGSGSNYPIFCSFGLPYIASNSDGEPFRLAYEDSGQKQAYSTTIPELDTWYHVFFTMKGLEIKVYINGVLENTYQANSFTFSRSTFDIGRHYDSDTYRIWGRVDDVRFYDTALTQKEIDILVNPELDTTKVSFKPNGDIITQGSKEEVDWELLNNFVNSNTDEGIIQFDDSIDSRRLSTEAEISADGWTTYITNTNHTSYTQKKGYVAAFYSSGPVGYIQKTLPAGYDMVRVKWGNWYTGTSNIKMDGVIVQDLVPSESGEYYTAAYTGTPVLRIEENGMFWISEVWVGKSKELQNSIIDGKQDATMIFNGLSPTQTKYSQWIPGTGTVGDFNVNGSATENNRKYGGGPWGESTVIWNCYPDATSGADGGWNTDRFPIDRNCLYRYSVWVRRNNINQGRFYQGTHGYGSTDGIYNRSDSGLNTNPYCYHSVTGLVVNQWNLVIGHIWVTGAGTGIEHPNSGIYSNYERTADILTDHYWHPTSTESNARNYLYYTTNTAQRQKFAYPLFEKCDGTETPIADLISGKAYTNLGRVPDENIDLGDAQQSIANSGIIINGKIINK